MNASRQLIRALCLATGLGSIVTASAIAGPACDPMWHQQERHAKMKEQHHQQLHAALKLAPEQEPGWSKLIESERFKPGMPSKQEDWSTLKAPERAERMLELAKARHEKMIEHTAALKAFYGTLTPEQQKIFDDFHSAPRKGMRGRTGRAATPSAPAQAAP